MRIDETEDRQENAGDSILHPPILKTKVISALKIKICRKLLLATLKRCHKCCHHF